MDIANLVQYDATIEVELVTETGLKTGVFFEIASNNCKEAKAVQSKITSKAILMNAGKSKDNPEAGFMSLMDMQKEKLCASIKGWKWNGHEWGSLGKDPKFTKENLLEVLKAEWVNDFLAEQVADIANFTKG